jgi:hypothetical protein
MHMDWSLPMSTSLGRRLDADVALDTFEPLREVNSHLIRLLRGLGDDDWAKPTVHLDRNVKGLMAHLLHGSLRRVTSHRDHYRWKGQKLNGLTEVISFVQADNRRFMDGMSRISPQILIEMIEIYDEAFLQIASTLDPNAQGLGVMWAGEDVSLNWFDMAREYTEKWHHQRQIRDAVGAPLLNAPHLIGPAIDTFARGLPFAYRSLNVPDGSQISVAVCDGFKRSWSLWYRDGSWSLWEGTPTLPITTISIPADMAWRLWTKGLDKAEMRARCVVTGDLANLEPILNFVAIMA